ncbi:NUDIX hydrolase [Saccharothrix sp. HUAS TT1]|uniref:NUDIX hydrolase n=1 Tax=unclassified Saccharothrix TaxID=2593673 RepID=UPI00345C4D59
MLNYRTGADSTRGGLDLVLSLTPDQAEALGTDAALIGEAVDTVLVGIAALRQGRDPHVPPGAGTSFKDSPVSAGRFWSEWVLQDTSSLLARLEGVLDAATRAHQADGGSYGSLANCTGVTKTTAQYRRDTLARSEPSPAELWATGTRVDGRHPGAKVPANLRTWKTPWHGYIPVDVTPDHLTAEGMRDAGTPEWAEPYPTPSEVPDWRDRQARALVPFDFDDRRWPLNPFGRTGRVGRLFGHWGEKQAADALVLAGTGADRRALLVKRGDIEEWAVPGGMLDEGETARDALVRELREETGVDVAGVEPLIISRTYVEDWRVTDNSWVVTTLAVFRVPEVVPATGADDAVEARWVPAADLDGLVAALEADGGRLYGAHRPLLAAALEKCAD